MAVVAGLALTLPASIVAHGTKSAARQAAGMTLGAAAAIAASVVCNLVVTPLYTAVSMADVIAMIVPILLPFNLLKALLNCMLSGLVKDPVALALAAQGQARKPSNPHASHTSAARRASASGDKNDPADAGSLGAATSTPSATGAVAGRHETVARLSHVTLFYGDAATTAPDEPEVTAGASQANSHARNAGTLATPAPAASVSAPALNDVSLTINAGERVAILGANGSGKSTLAQILCGLTAPDQGTVELLGTTVCAGGIADLAAYAQARRALGLVFQNPDDQIVTSVVADDVAFGPENLGLPSQEIARRVQRELTRVALLDRADADPSRLSGGQKQRVCIAGALAMEPRLLVLDEPGALLDVRGRAAIMRVMARLKAAGTTLVHVTHFMDEALTADRVIVMDQGHVALQGAPHEVFSEKNFELIQQLGLEEPYAVTLSSMLAASGVPISWAADEKPLVQQLVDLAADNGPFADIRRADHDSNSERAIGLVTPSDQAKATRPTSASASPSSDATNTPNTTSELARVDHVSFAYTNRSAALNNVSLSIKSASVTAIVGQTGSGKSTLLRLLCGLEVPDAGTVTVAGATTSTSRGRQAVRDHVGLVMQHPERQLFAKTVWEDVAFGPRNLGLSDTEVTQRVTRALQLVGLANRADTSPFALSGGQKRLAALAGVLAMRPELLILDEPMAGLDPRGRRLVRSVLSRLAANGTTLVQVTHSMEDAARADQVIVLNQSQVLMAGTPAAVFSPEHAKTLADAGLGLPRALTFALQLEAAGYPTLGNPLTTSELAKHIQQTLSGEKSTPACDAAAPTSAKTRASQPSAPASAHTLQPAAATVVAPATATITSKESRHGL